MELPDNPGEPLEVELAAAQRLFGILVKDSTLRKGKQSAAVLAATAISAYPLAEIPFAEDELAFVKLALAAIINDRVDNDEA